MKRSRKPRRTRWSSTASTSTPYTQSERAGRQREKDARELSAPTLGPYEASYDVSHGYSHERSIVFP